jgi:hypothetical protein
VMVLLEIEVQPQHGRDSNPVREEHHFTVIALNLEDYVQTCFLKGSLPLAILNLVGKKTQSVFFLSKCQM